MKSVTIYDIAREAGVGIGTVSRVLNNHRNVSEGTRRRVLSVAKKLRYQPHSYARALAQKKSSAIMIILPFHTTFFFSEFLEGVHQIVTKQGYDLLLSGINDPEGIATDLKDLRLRGRADGILFCSMRLPEQFRLVCKELEIPIVIVDGQAEGIDSVSVENELGGYLAVKHFVSLGHKKIGMISANPRSTPAAERIAGYKRALSESLLSFDPRLLRISDSKKLDGFAKETGYSLMKELLSLGEDRPTAVFVSSDIQAVGALVALREGNVLVPEDMAIIGFDDIALAAELGLSTVRQPIRDIGKLGVELLLRRLQHPGFAPQSKKFKPELIIRRTSEINSERPFHSSHSDTEHPEPLQTEPTYV